MKKYFMLLVLVLLSTLAVADKVILTTLDWEPYIGQNLPDQGYVAEIVRTAFQMAGHEVEFKFLPWNRAVAEAKSGKANGYFPEYYSKETENEYFFSIPLPGGPLGFFVLSDSNIKYHELKDLSAYSIGVVRGYVNTEEFDNATFLKKEEADNDLTNLKKLLGKRIDMVIMDKFVGQNLIATSLPEAKEKLKFVEPPLEKKDLFVCLNRKGKEAEKLIDDFNNAITKMEKSGKIKEILKKHGF